MDFLQTPERSTNQRRAPTRESEHPMSGNVTALKQQPEKISLAQISESVVHLVSENDAFKHITIDGVDFIDWREPASAWERDVITNCLKSLIGTAKTIRLGRMFKVSSLSENYRQLKAKVLDEYVGDKDITEVNQPGLYAFFKILEGDQKAVIDAYEARIASGVLEFNDFPLHFKAEDEIIILHGDDPIGGVIDDVKFYSSFFGDGWNVEISVIHTLSGMPIEANLTIPVPAWSGTMPISELPIVPAEGELRQKLAARGRILAGIATGASYMRYKGEMTQTGWSGKTSFRADGRIMIDPRSCRRIDGDRYRNETRRTGLEFDDNNEDKVTPFEIGEDDLWRTYPFVIGFSFRTKKWGTFRVADISPVDWRNDAFDYLVMDDNEKNIIKALVATRGQGFQDIVDEKGGGTIFLLEGKPGLGKTLTAETVAEMTRQPIYAISVGELGTDPSQLEKNL
ncbi:MAG: AAA family ATPase, partial [Sweet potato little leaf phytoplasma]|nr:AAA family ATPase [Sweet potato little leaf phytoplasma]